VAAANRPPSSRADGISRAAATYSRIPSNRRVKAAANTTGALSTQSEQLSREVDLFLAGVKAA
jgi:hypothetical protein